MADKLDMKSMDITGANIEKIRALFPSAVTEVMGEDGKVKLAIDFDALKQELSDDLISEKAERYQMTWPDKSKAKVLANSRITATLRPDKEKSVDFDTTQNLYIEGDNLDVLKLLRETYLGKVKMIYIDPPYNTGNDFIYPDDFAISSDEYKEISGYYDDQGNKLSPNPESNGRFHTDWLNMIYPRLKVARDLLADDGVIFISIDDNEVDNLKKVCDEVFGQNNFIGLTVRVSSPTQNIAKFMSIMHDYSLVYCKSKDINGGDWKVPKNNVEEFEARAKKLFKSGASPEEIATELRALVKYPRFYDFDHYYFCDEGGIFRAGPIGGVQSGNTTTQILHPITNKPCKMPKGGWRYKETEINRLVKEGKLLFGKDESVVPQTKLYLHDYLTQIPKGINFFDTQSDVHFLSDNGLPFDFPKPVEYIEYFTRMINANDDSIILDFFSGSATTAHAVMQLNAEDGGHRRFIMVQLPEKCDEKSEAYKAGYKTICDIGQERIRRAGRKILEELGVRGKELDGQLSLTTESYPLSPKLDIGFRVLKLDSSNMQEVYYNPSAMTQDILAMTVDNVKADRTPLDLLFQVMLDLGVELSAKIEEHTVSGKTYYTVNGNDIIACFDDNIDNDVIVAIAKQNPLYAVFKDKSFATDSVGINNEQLFKTYSPSTVVKVI